ncbi:polymer-forming cytoskeletal protein [Nesterenkonia sp. NBAIMH1]|uniref:polymer-forming cytoskeletal protein n=1 Tax=Nesterenkonia sp. NBAIMH1 TaxID=2600320 RepID=UPI0011B79BCC|nr:polymer-forming cytoskeletal protein [Nesterenkonia sp. NBAIMH1]
MKLLSQSRRILPIVLALGLLGLVSAPLAIGASSETALVPASASTADETDEREPGPQFYSGSVLDVDGEIEGDVYASGQSITISGDVDGDVIAAGQTVSITGDIDGDVRIAAQNVSIIGAVSGSGTVLASTISIPQDGSFGTDLVGAATEIRISGDIGRDLLVGVSRLTLVGPVGGDVTYYSDREATIDGAVAGSVERVEAAPASEAGPDSPWESVLGWLLGLLYSLVALSLITVLAAALMPRQLSRVTDQLFRTPWKALIVGFAASLLVPLVLLFLLITIVGAPLGLAGILLWTVLVLATFVYGSHFVGRVVLRKTSRPIPQTLVGGLLLILALNIPWVGIAVWLAMLFFGVGAQLLDFHSRRAAARHESVAEQ